MKRWQWLCVIAFIFGPSEHLAAAPQVFRSTVQVHGEAVHIMLAADQFDYKAHHFERDKNGRILVDGIRAIGTDSFEPARHLSRFDVDWNGRHIRIAAQLFDFVFNPSLEGKTSSFSEKGSVLVLPGDSNDAILVILSGGDGAGAFNAWWIIRKDGRVSRFSDGPP